MTTGRPPLRHSWVSSDRPVARLVARPLREFMHTEAAGGILLLVATLVALAWANSPVRDSYEELWTIEIGVRIGDFDLTEDLRHWVNDGLMTIFFFVVGLEIKRELVAGELNEPRRAAFPALAALGGMVVPALIYAIVNAGGAGEAGWAIPMATDIAFAVGVLSLMGRRSPDSLRTFLLSLAIVDDIGAILVIAFFYSAGIELGWLGAGLFLVAVIIFMRERQLWWIPLYVVVGVALWFATLQSGVHATIAGVALGLLTPARPADPEGAGDAVAEASALMREPEPAGIRRLTMQAQEAVSMAERLEHILHPWTSYAVIPIFALANAGVSLSRDSLASAFSSPVTLGIVAGLVGGKLLGVTGFSWAAARIGIASLPRDVNRRHVVGAGAIAGIGFTVSLFIAGLAFDDMQLVDEAKIGILLGSTIAALLGVSALIGEPNQTKDRDVDINP
ncbi:MAG: Na+/H+ antiporter NhaA [Actinomycetota bacterium]|nr:Na+/H+ antiporter NhaA [Actinomycetota bacterium]